MKLEKATVEDIKEIVKLYADRMKWFYDNNIVQWRKYLKNHPKNEILNVIKNGNYYVLRSNDEIVGGFEISTDSHFWDDDETSAYYLYKLVTKVGTKKIGSKIFDIVKKMTITDNKECLRTECLATNKKLNEIYESYGFKYVREGKDYYHYILREWKVNK